MGKRNQRADLLSAPRFSPYRSGQDHADRSLRPLALSSALVISPYSRGGVVNHTRFDFTSPLKLIETRFDLEPLTDRDADSNNMLDCFDFDQKPLDPIVITADTKLDFGNLVTTQP
jgi:phospholipase C